METFSGHLGSLEIIGNHWGSWRIIRVCSHLINIEGILLKLKIDAVVESLDGPPLLLHHHQHNLTAPPADISHHSEVQLLMFACPRGEYAYVVEVIDKLFFCLFYPRWLLRQVER